MREPHLLTWPAPLDKTRCYIGVIGDLVAAIEPHTEADPAALLLQMLTMFGSVIGRTAHFRVGADLHFLNLFTAVVGETAKGRKGVSHGRARQVFEPVDPAWVKDCRTSGLSSGEGLIDAVRDPVEKLQPVRQGGRVIDSQMVIEDAGVSDKRLLVTEAEFASTLAVMTREGNTLSAVVRQAWDGHDLRTLTKSSKSRATAPHISIIAMITCNELKRRLDATEAGNGFGNRFLWVCVKRSKELPDGGRMGDLSGLTDRLRHVVNHARAVTELRRDGACNRSWEEIYGRLSAGRPGMLGALTARAEAQTMRLACLFALSDCSAVITRSHLQAALEVWRYCFESAVYLFGDRLGDPTADEILSALRRLWPESLTRSEISRGLFMRNKPAAEIDRALVLLEQHRLARHDIDRGGDGRPTERWVFEPLGMHDINDIDDITPPAGPSNVVNVVNVVAQEGEHEDGDDESADRERSEL